MFITMQFMFQNNSNFRVLDNDNKNMYNITQPFASLPSFLSNIEKIFSSLLIKIEISPYDIVTINWKGILIN